MATVIGIKICDFNYQNKGYEPNWLNACLSMLKLIINVKTIILLWIQI